MEIDLKYVPKLKTILQKIENDPIVIEIEDERFVFNDTAKEIWDRINGLDCIEEIVEKIHEAHKEDHQKEYVELIVMEAIEIFYDKQFIELK